MLARWSARRSLVWATVGLALLSLPLTRREEARVGGDLASWLVELAEVPLDTLVGEVKGGRRGVRRFEPCVADLVMVEGEEQVLGEVTGAARVEFPEGSRCRESLGVVAVEGVWGEEGPQGRGETTLEDGRMVEAMYRSGEVWGVVRTWRCLYGSCTEWEGEEESTPSHLESAVQYSGGEVVEGSAAWWLPVGGGVLSCSVGRAGAAQGAGCGYIYSGLAPALVGEWAGGMMVGAVPGSVGGLVWGEGSLLPRATWVTEEGGQAVAEDISTATRISSSPMVEDAYDARTVYIAESSIPGAHEGVFLRRDLARGTLAATYNGVRMPLREARRSREERRSMYKVQGWGDTVLNVPQAFTSTANYSATLGHKVNHAREANAEFQLLEHPRFGEVVGVFATRDLVAGQELTVNYGYMEKYMATQAGVKMMLTAAQAVAGYSDTREFHRYH